MSVNAFRALERIILHLVRLVLHYFAHNIAHIACFSIILLFYRSVIRSSYISSSAFMHVYRISYIYIDGLPLSLELDKFSPPLLEKKRCGSSLALAKLFVRKNFVENNFYPRISTLLNLLLIELQQLPPVFLLTFPLEMRPTVSPTLLRHTYSLFSLALSPRCSRWSKCISNLYSQIVLYRIKKQEENK